MGEMERVWRARTLAALVCGLAIGVAPRALAQGEARVGTWELDLARSSFSPGPPPRKQTLVFRAAGTQWTALLQGVDAEGRPINPDLNNLAITFDGRDHPTATVDYDTTAWKRSRGTSYEVIRRKGGKIVMTSTNELSADGRTMTIRTTGVTANGQRVDTVRVYQKKDER